MNTSKCPLCGGNMTRYGKTKAGSQRWRCPSCKATSTRRIDKDAKTLREFLSWLLSGKRQADMPGEGRSFRMKTSKFWNIWPMPPLVDEIHDVVYVDGIYLARNTVVLIAANDKHVLGWYLARSENSSAWSALLSRIAPPDVVVTDGGSGFEKARRMVWPDTSVQRCTFHAFCQVKRYTTSRPKLPAGVELYGLAKDLLHIKDAVSATNWLAAYNDWCLRWREFLAETTVSDGRRELTHEKLVSAQRSLTRLIKGHVLFTYIDPSVTQGRILPATNNRIEGGINAPLRQMLRDHRGMSVERRIKAVFWWCYMHTEYPLSPAELLKVMPTDHSVDSLYRANRQGQLQGGVQEWGDAIVWNEFHTSGPYRMDWD